MSVRVRQLPAWSSQCFTKGAWTLLKFFPFVITCWPTKNRLIILLVGDQFNSKPKSKGNATHSLIWSTFNHKSRTLSDFFWTLDWVERHQAIFLLDKRSEVRSSWIQLTHWTKRRSDKCQPGVSPCNGVQDSTGRKCSSVSTIPPNHLFGTSVWDSELCTFCRVSPVWGFARRTDWNHSFTASPRPIWFWCRENCTSRKFLPFDQFAAFEKGPSSLGAPSGLGSTRPLVHLPASPEVLPHHECHPPPPPPCMLPVPGMPRAAKQFDLQLSLCFFLTSQSSRATKFALLTRAVK